MKYFEFISASGIGAIIGIVIMKLFDIWSQKIIEKREKKRWLSDKQLKAFSKLSKELMSFRLIKETSDIYNPFEFRAIASESILLIDDKKIINQIEEFIARLDALYTKRAGNEEKQESEYNKLYKKSLEIVNALGKILIEKKVN